MISRRYRGLSSIKEVIDDGGLLDVQAHFQPVWVFSTIVEVDVRDVCPTGRDVLEKIKEGAGLVRQVDVKRENPKRWKGLLQISDGVQIVLHRPVYFLCCRHFKENRGCVDPSVVVNPVDIAVVLLDDLGCSMESTRLVRHVSYE